LVQLNGTVSEFSVTVIALFETTIGALTAVVPLGMFSIRSCAGPAACRSAGMLLIFTLTVPVTLPLLPTTMMAFRAAESR
jgi:hypothetical protein